MGKRVWGGVAAMMAVSLLGRAALAEDVPPPPPPPGQAIGDILDLYFDLCLGAFPDDAKVAEQVAKRSATPIAVADIPRFLHNDPGHGWIVKGQDGSNYAVTIEHPPYHACAVRHLYAQAPDYWGTYQLAIGVWAASEHRSLQGLPVQTGAMNGVRIEAHMHQIPAADGKPAEGLMAITTPYANGPTELRLVRSIGPQ
jgi:hypothetical protein